jgi:hypothetical protein
VIEDTGHEKRVVGELTGVIFGQIIQCVQANIASLVIGSSTWKVIKKIVIDVQSSKEFRYWNVLENV